MPRKTPDACGSMAELRVQIDDLDRDLIQLLAERATYIDRAVTLKQQENLNARITSRVEQVIGNVRKQADEQGLDPDLAEALWRTLIEWAIQREAQHIPE